MCRPGTCLYVVVAVVLGLQARAGLCSMGQVCYTALGLKFVRQVVGGRSPPNTTVHVHVVQEGWEARESRLLSCCCRCRRLAVCAVGSALGDAAGSNARRLGVGVVLLLEPLSCALCQQQGADMHSGPLVCALFLGAALQGTHEGCAPQKSPGHSPHTPCMISRTGAYQAAFGGGVPARLALVGCDGVGRGGAPGPLLFDISVPLRQHQMAGGKELQQQRQQFLPPKVLRVHSERQYSHVCYC